MKVLRRWPFLVVMAWLLLSSLSAAADMVDVDIAPLQTGQSIMREMHMLRESAGKRVELGAAHHAKDWQPVRWKHLTSALQPETIWLGAGLYNSSKEPVRRLLTVDDWRLASVELWLLDPVSGAVRQYIQGGTRQSLAERPGMAMESVFSIELPPGEHVHAMWRIQGGAWHVIDVRMWEPQFFRVAEHREQMLHAALFGVMCALALVLLLFRSWRLAVLAAWLVAALAHEAAALGYITGYLAPAAREYFPWIIVALAVLRVMCFTAVACIVSELCNHRVWRTVYIGLIVLQAHVLLSYFFVDLLQAQWLALLSILLVLHLWPISLLSVRAHGDRYKQALLALLSLCWGMAVLRLVHNLHVAQLHLLFDHAHLVLIVQIVASLGIVGIYIMGQQAKERRLQQNIRTIEHGQRATLERLVALRTAELEQAIQRAEAANDAKNDFLARVSHDLRTPLTTIAGYAQLMQAEGGEIGRRAGIFRHSADHMLHLLTDLIEYARGAGGETLRMAPLYAHELFSNIAQEVEDLVASNNNHFMLEFDPELPPVLVLDGRRMRQVLINLLANAAKFTHDGTIKLTVESHADADMPQKIRLLVRVADTGQGMSADDRDRAFAPYFRGHNTTNKEGAGLGLPIVALWVKRMGGDVHLHSVLGIGTEVTVDMPVLVGTAGDLFTVPVIEPACPPVDAEVASTVREGLEKLPHAARADLERLLKMGAVTDIAAWASALPTPSPACQAFVDAVRMLAEEGRLSDIQCLLEGEAEGSR